MYNQMLDSVKNHMNSLHIGELCLRSIRLRGASAALLS